MDAATPPGPAGRRWWRRAAWGVGGLLLLHTALWWAAVRLLENEAANARVTLPPDWSVSHGAPARGGWPFAARLDLPDVHLVHQGDATIRLETLRLALDIRHPTRLAIAVLGRITLETADLEPLAFTAAEAAGHVSLTRPTNAVFRLRGLEGAMPAGLIHIAAADLTARFDPTAGVEGDALTTDFTFTGADLAGILAESDRGVGTRMDRFRANFTVSGPWRADLASPRAMATAWRDAGGKLTIQQLAATWARLDLDLQATITLDRALQPEGRGTLGAGGIAAMLDRMVGQGFIAPSAARTIKAVLSTMPTTPDGQVSVPVTLRGGAVQVARFPLLRVPPLQWR